MNNEAIAQSLVAELEARLLDLDAIGALVAAAHLDAAIQTLRKDYGLARIGSVTDQPPQDVLTR